MKWVWVLGFWGKPLCYYGHASLGGDEPLADQPPFRHKVDNIVPPSTRARRELSNRRLSMRKWKWLGEWHTSRGLSLRMDIQELGV